MVRCLATVYESRQLRIYISTHHRIVLREISTLVRPSTISIHILWLTMKAIKLLFYRTSRNEMLVTDVHDIYKDTFIDWIKTGLKRILHETELFLQKTVAQISVPPKLTGEPICDNVGVPNPKPLISDPASKIVDPKEIGESVKTLLREHGLSNAYNTLKYVATSDRIEDSKKGIWSTVILCK